MQGSKVPRVWVNRQEMARAQEGDTRFNLRGGWYVSAYGREQEPCDEYLSLVEHSAILTEQRERLLAEVAEARADTIQKVIDEVLTSGTIDLRWLRGWRDECKAPRPQSEAPAAKEYTDANR